MNKRIIVWLLTIALICNISLYVSGCSMIKTGFQDHKYSASDINNFVRIGTSIVLAEAKLPQEEAVKIQQYILKLQGYVAQNDVINFLQLRSYAQTLPEQYQFVGGTIIDIIERFVKLQVSNFMEEQAYVISLVSSGLEGAMSATQLYIKQLN